MRARPRSDATRLALLNAALDVAAEYGVKGVTHRRVAGAAGLSLGLTSYHFANLDDLLLEAFRLFVSHTSALYERQFHEATDLESMIDAALAVVNALKDSDRERTLLYELYAQSVRDPPTESSSLHGQNQRARAWNVSTAHAPPGSSRRPGKVPARS
ncbi:TetR/AcrR family transcriptional regulator [Pseudonocardia benzenivorans]